jgi:hypothetical protein
MISQLEEGFGLNTVVKLGVECITNLNPLTRNENFLKDVTFSVNLFGGKLNKSATQFKYLIIVHENLDFTADNSVKLFTYKGTNPVTQLKGKYYTAEPIPPFVTPRLSPVKDFADFNNTIQQNTAKKFIVTIFDLTREIDIDYISYAIFWLNGSGTQLPKITFFGSNDDSYNFFKAEQPNSVESLLNDNKVILQNILAQTEIQIAAIDILAKYAPARIDESDANITYTGLIDKDGNWCILKKDETNPADIIIQYITGSVDFVINWNNRTTLVYVEFNIAF